jgi:hypothetical protein
MVGRLFCAGGRAALQGRVKDYRNSGFSPGAKVTSDTTPIVGVDNVHFAATVGLESGYVLNPDNHLNQDGSLDIGPAQLNVQDDHGPLDASVYGTALDPGEAFNGDPFSNLIEGARVFKSKGKAEYYVGQESRRFSKKMNQKIRRAQVQRRSALNALAGPFEKFIDCLLH